MHAGREHDLSVEVISQSAAVRARGVNECHARNSELTSGEVAARLLPQGHVVVEDDASPVHAQAAQAPLASEARGVLAAPQHVTHCRGAERTT